MDNEISSSIQMVIAMMIMAVVIGMISLFNQMGVTFKREAVAKIADTQAETYATELLNTAGYGPLPATSAYTMLLKNADAVKSLSGKAYEKYINETEDLVPLFGKKVILRIVDPEKKQERYDIVVEEEK
jgi:hypothetical protein